MPLDDKVYRGEFVLDERGWERFVPDEDTRERIDAWINTELNAAIENHRVRWQESAQNLEAYRPVSVTLKNEGGTSVLPSPDARIPADQIIANTFNNVTRFQPIMSFDAHFPSTIEVLVPLDREKAVARLSELSANGQALALPEDAPDVLPSVLSVSAEEQAQTFERGYEFKARERLDIEKHLHKAIALAVSGAPPIWKTFAHDSKRTTMAPRKPRGYDSTSNTISPFVDTEDVEEIDVQQEIVRWQVIPYHDFVTSNIDDDEDDVPLCAERNHDLADPQDLVRAYERKELSLLKDEEECKKAASARSTTIDENKARTDAKIQKWEPQDTTGKCDVWDVWCYVWAEATTPRSDKPVKKRFSMLIPFHRGLGKSLDMYRNPYRHQRRPFTRIQQYIDGASTVGISRHAQLLQTYLTQHEVRAAFNSQFPTKWYDPNSPKMADFVMGVSGGTIAPEEWVPGIAGTDWGIQRIGQEHQSMLPLMQWNVARNDSVNRNDDYQQGNRVVSHTSPQVVAAMLDRGGQPQILFLKVLNRAMRRITRLTLETMRQFQPLGDNIPVRDEKTRQTIMIPFRLPIGDVLDNFRISLTAADEAAARERDSEQMAIDLETHRNHTVYVSEIVRAMRDEKATPEDLSLFRKMLEGEQELYSRIISTTRADPKKFDLMPEVDRLVEETQKALSQMAAMPPQMGGISGAANTAPAMGGNPNATIPQGQPTGLAGSGAESGMASGPAGVAVEGGAAEF